MTTDIKELVKRLREEADHQHDLAHDCDCAPEATANWAAMLDIRAAIVALEDLAEWKRQALALEATWDAQAVGRLIKVPLGGNILPAIQPALEALAGEVERREACLCYKGGWIDRAKTAEAERDRLKAALRGIARNAEDATDLPLFRVQCRDFARSTLGDAS